MSKNRRIPFGYIMENGEITTEPREVYAVAKIFDEYIAGKSLQNIANMMQIDGIPYHPQEKSQWNRNMVKRILENEKYLGTDKYPQLVDKAKFDKVNEIKNKKATNLCIVPEDMKDIRNMAICSECRKRLLSKVVHLTLLIATSSSPVLPSSRSPSPASFCPSRATHHPRQIPALSAKPEAQGCQQQGQARLRSQDYCPQLDLELVLELFELFHLRRVLLVQFPSL